ncbi:MAG: hypothetical protein IJ658_07805 [Kiritimatiellae bacterium]|nr:hypothetical protein [Kiritimatiellia bacterium]
MKGQEHGSGHRYRQASDGCRIVRVCGRAEDARRQMALTVMFDGLRADDIESGRTPSRARSRGQAY